MVPGAICEQKDTLTKRCDQAKDLFIRAAQKVGSHPTGGFDQAYKEAGEARASYDIARDTLAAHVKEHGC